MLPKLLHFKCSVVFSICIYDILCGIFICLSFCNAIECLFDIKKHLFLFSLQAGNILSNLEMGVVNEQQSSDKCGIYLNSVESARYCKYIRLCEWFFESLHDIIG